MNAGRPKPRSPEAEAIELEAVEDLLDEETIAEIRRRIAEAEADPSVMIPFEEFKRNRERKWPLNTR